MPTAGAELHWFGPSPRWRLLSGRELWQHREVLWTLALRDLKVRYRQTLVGVAWVVIHPVAMGMVFVVFFGLLGHQPSQGDVPYPLVLLSGLLLWQLFAATITQASASLVVNQHLIGKVYFPRILLPLATVVPNLVDFSIGLLVPAGLMVHYVIVPSWTVLLLPLFVLLAVAAALAIGIGLSALNAMYRDAGYLVPVLLQIGFFISPVVYATGALIPPRWQPIVALNPMVGAVEGLRWSLFAGNPFPAASVLTSAAVTSLLLLAGLLYFRRVEGVLADRI